jgi:hypothetical protein
MHTPQQSSTVDSASGIDSNVADCARTRDAHSASTGQQVRDAPNLRPRRLRSDAGTHSELKSQFEPQAATPAERRIPQILSRSQKKGTLLNRPHLILFPV